MYQSKTVDQVGWLLRILRLIARESRIFYYSTKRKSASDEQRTHLSQTCLWWKPQEQPISQMSVIKKQFTHAHTHTKFYSDIYYKYRNSQKKKVPKMNWSSIQTTFSLKQKVQGKLKGEKTEKSRKFII